MRKRAAISLGIIALLLVAALIFLPHMYEQCSRASCYSVDGFKASFRNNTDVINMLKEKAARLDRK